MNQNHQENLPIFQNEIPQESQQDNNNLKQVFALIEHNFDKYMFDSIIKMFEKVKCFDFIDYLSNHTTRDKEFAGEYFRKLIPSQPTMKNQQNIRQVLEQLIEIFQSLKNQDFFHFNYLNNKYEVERLKLIHRIQNNEKSLEFLKLLVRLTAIDSHFIQCGSNSLNLLVELRADLKYQSFEKIRIKDTSLVGANFAYSNLSCSKFDNVDINGINLNGAILFNCKWNNLSIQELSKLDGHSNVVNQVCFSLDGSTLASVSRDNSIRLWDVKKGQQKAKLDCDDIVNSVCFSPDGYILASGCKNGSILLSDVQKGRLIRKLDGHHDNVLSVCFSPDGSTLASGSHDKSICLWDVKKGQQRAKLDGHSSIVTSVCFSPDGSSLASGSFDESIRLWNVKTWQQKTKLDGHMDIVWSVCFSPDGSSVASGSGDKSICLWDIKTGQLKAKLDGHSDTVYSVCFSPDGSTLLLS